MQFPESWLREFCDPPITSAALAELLTMSGMEVEETRAVAPPFSGVVVGHVLAAVQLQGIHPRRQLQPQEITALRLRDARALGEVLRNHVQRQGLLFGQRLAQLPHVAVITAAFQVV